MKHTLIGSIYRNLYKPLLFRRDPEDVHDAFTKMGRTLGKSKITKAITRALFSYQNEEFLKQDIAGVQFRNPVGLSAGFDKDANLQNILPDVGFGYMQIGSVTLHPYEGNPKPRLYRLPKSSGLVVYYGLKNIGVDKIIKKIKDYKNPKFPLSISIAKTNSKKTSSDEEGAEDYKECLRKVIDSDVGDFYTINISCPNTYGGEPFTTPDKLKLLLGKLRELEINKPLFIKMPINLKWDDFESLLEVVVEYQLDGVIIGNLNKDRDSEKIKEDIPENIKGGVSGFPTRELSNNLIAKTYKKYRDKLVIVGVGGIFTAEDAYEKIKLGSHLIQMITGMIYRGPQTIGEINKGLVKLLKKDGYKNISEAVGSVHKE